MYFRCASESRWEHMKILKIKRINHVQGYSKASLQLRCYFSPCVLSHPKSRRLWDKRISVAQRDWLRLFVLRDARISIPGRQTKKKKKKKKETRMVHFISFNLSQKTGVSLLATRTYLQPWPTGKVGMVFFTYSALSLYIKRFITK